MFHKNMLVILMMLCVAAILTVFVYQRPSITGMATTTGNMTVTINSTSSIQFAIASVNWGTGAVNTTTGTCTLDTAGTTTGCTGFTAVNQPLVVENNGNTNLSVTLYSNASGAQFIGPGTTFQWKIDQNESGSCTTTPSPGSYSDVNVSLSNATTICSNLGFTDSNDSLKIDLKVVIPLAVMTGGTGQKSATLTVTGS